jgi:hypothetical protein
MANKFKNDPTLNQQAVAEQSVCLLDFFTSHGVELLTPQRIMADSCALQFWQATAVWTGN